MFHQGFQKIDESTGHLLINIRSSTVILLEIDFQTHVFGYLITRVSICSSPDIMTK